jgi:hypothetical protein
MKIYPVKGGEGLRDPRTKRRIPAEGLEVTLDPFWLQRLAHGDVSEKTPDEQAADAAAIAAKRATAAAKPAEVPAAAPPEAAEKAADVHPPEAVEQPGPSPAEHQPTA